MDVALALESQPRDTETIANGFAIQCSAHGSSGAFDRRRNGSCKGFITTGDHDVIQLSQTDLHLAFLINATTWSIDIPDGDLDGFDVIVESSERRDDSCFGAIGRALAKKLLPVMNRDSHEGTP